MGDIKYKIVDADGDRLDACLFKPYPVVHPVRVTGVVFDDEGNLTMVLRYLHDEETN